jgi:hypothetical protein
MDAREAMPDASTTRDTLVFADVREALDARVLPDAAMVDAFAPPDAPSPDAALATDARVLDAFVADDALASTCGDLRLYFRFEEASGVVVDESGCGNHGTTFNVLRREMGTRGYAYRFGRPGGSEARVTVPDSASLRGLSQFTFEAWVNDTGSPYSFIAVHADEVTMGRFAFGPSPAHQPNLVLRSGSGCVFNGMFNAPAPFTTSAWTHLAVTVDTVSAEVIFYVDGVEVHRALSSDIAAPLCDEGYPLFIGAIPRARGFYSWNGWIDELRIWSVVRSRSEVCIDAGGVPWSGGCSL